VKHDDFSAFRKMRPEGTEIRFYCQSDTRLGDAFFHWLTDEIAAVFLFVLRVLFRQPYGEHRNG
jgi:hypothetical protein